MPIRVLGSNGKGSTLEIERGVEWALSKGADVINLSLGGTRFFKDAKDQHRSSLYELAKSKNVIVFASAGNSSYKLGKYYEAFNEETRKTSKGYVYSYPGSYDNVITVAATNAKNQLTGFSNHGFGVDIATPGSLTLSTYPGGTYKNMSGTFMAAPIAAGSYALVLSGLRKSKIERFRYGDVYPLLTKATGAGKFNKDDVLSQGVLDVHKLLVTARAKLVPEPEDETPQPQKPEPETPQESLEPLVPEPPMDICSFQP
ncbi:MAG: S8 family serine peptidase [Pseudobdellovibrionaceae bacterium]|nr:S8 family serine peptidase [Pseudobdellovibrionaceae bacterium]